MQVLLIEHIEDDFRQVNSFADIIDDIQLDWCDSLARGLAYLESHPVDVLLIDAELPDEDVLTVLDQLQTQLPLLPVIILSRENTDERALAGIRHGAQDYLQKSTVNAEILGRSMRYAVERKRRDIAVRNQMEATLRETEALQTIFQLLPVGASVINNDRRVVQMNVSLEKILDMTMQDLLMGKYRSRQYIHNDGTPVAQTEFPSERAFIEQKPILDVEIGVIKENREIIWTSVSAAPLPNNQGVVTVTADITERNRQRSALQDTERQYRLLAQNSPDVIYVMDLIQQRATYLNRPEFLGYSQNELETPGLLLAALHPDDKPLVLAHWREDVMSGNLADLSAIEYRLQDKSGHWRWVQSRETIFAFTSDGKPTQVLITLTDITERKQAEANLTLERDLLRTLIDSSPDYIFIKDTEGRFLLSNVAHAQAAGLAPEEMVGKTASEVFPANLAVQFEADDERVLRRGEALINLERSTLGQHHEPRMVLTTKIPLRDTQGRITRMVGISRDITERKQLEVQMFELEAERKRIAILRRFINNMSHDFRTPLTIISSSLYLVQKTTDPEKKQIHLQKAEHQIVRLGKLLSEILQMELLDEEKTSFALSLTEMNAFLSTHVSDYERMTVPKQIMLEFIPDTASCFARIDPVQFATALKCLLDNAIAYTAEGGSIIVRAKTQSNLTVVSIQDTGIGIASKDLPHIFERFYRADNARSSQTGGSGLGLSIAQKIVQAHHGKIEVESVVGQGSIFSIQLPVS